MRRNLGILFLALAVAFSFPDPLFAQKGKSSGGSVHVRGYTRKDGTYVAPHERSAPDSSKANNWSTKGNVNPYTGKPGTHNLSPSGPAVPQQLAPPRTTAATPNPASPQQSALEKAEADSAALDKQRKLAEGGDPWSSYQLGVRYLTGNGVPKDEDAGRAWLEKAAQKGHNLAYEKLKNTDFEVEKRDDKGRIIRSATARKEFMRMTGYPNGRPGYVIDHIVPLKRGGADTPENMQWQTIAEARAKDKWE